jgi:hypothetical protein
MIASIQDYTPELGLAVTVEFFVIFVGGVGVTGCVPFTNGSH